MKIPLPILPTTLCILSAVTIPYLHAQELESESSAETALLEITGTTVQGEAHENLANIDEFIEARFSMIAIADPDRIYDPFGLVKDGEIEPPEVEEIAPPIETTDDNQDAPVAVAPDLLKTTVDALQITGFNSGGGSILLGVNEIAIGQLIPGNNDVYLADVKPTKITFKSKSSGKEYARPVGFNPSGVQSRNDFINNIQGVAPR